MMVRREALVQAEVSEWECWRRSVCIGLVMNGVCGGIGDVGVETG